MEQNDKRQMKAGNGRWADNHMNFMCKITIPHPIVWQCINSIDSYNLFHACFHLDFIF